MQRITVPRHLGGTYERLAVDRATEFERKKEASCSRFQEAYLKLCIELEDDTVDLNTMNECRPCNTCQNTPSQDKHHATDFRIVDSFLKTANISGSSKVHFLIQDTCGSAQTNINFLQGWKDMPQLEKKQKPKINF